MQSTTVVGDEDALYALIERPSEPAKPTLEDPIFRDLRYNDLALELARRIHPLPIIARRFGLTLEQVHLLCAHPPFQRMVRIEKAVWEGSENAGARAKTYHQEGQALVASHLVAMITDPGLTAMQQLEVAKLSAKIAGIDAAPKDGNTQASGGSFSVNIHLGDGRVERIGAMQTVEPIQIEGAPA